MYFSKSDICRQVEKSFSLKNKKAKYIFFVSTRVNSIHPFLHCRRTDVWTLPFVVDAHSSRYRPNYSWYPERESPFAETMSKTKIATTWNSTPTKEKKTEILDEAVIHLPPETPPHQRKANVHQLTSCFRVNQSTDIIQQMKIARTCFHRSFWSTRDVRACFYRSVRERKEAF